MIGRGLPSTLRTDFRQRHPVARLRIRALLGGRGACSSLLLLPLALSNFWTGICNQIFIAVIGALALNLLMGTTGQISLGHAGFVAAGAFTVAALVTHVDAPLAVTLPAAAIVGGYPGRAGRPSGPSAEGTLSRRQHARGAISSSLSGSGNTSRRSAMARASPFRRQPCSGSPSAPSALGISFCSRLRWACCCLNVNWLRSAYGAPGWRSAIATLPQSRSASMSRTISCSRSARARRSPALPARCGPITRASSRSKPLTSIC